MILGPLFMTIWPIVFWIASFIAPLISYTLSRVSHTFPSTF